VLTKENNDLLTQTGPGTPGGDLLRRYWQPVALSQELAMGGAPVPVRILSEDLVLFRDDSGAPGLLGIHCAHRGADLSYGRLEDGGLRCIYHGWLYDKSGRCLEQPGEPAGSTFHERIRQKAYPCFEKGGVIFTYMGQGERPIFPAYEFVQEDESKRYVDKYFHDCNYLQGNEGNIDPGHLSFLHRFFREDLTFSRPPQVGANGSNTISQTSSNALYGRDLAPDIEIEETDFGVRIFSVRDAGQEGTYLRISNFIYPNLAAFPGGGGNDGYSVNWHVPIDDTTHWKFSMTFSRTAPTPRERIQEQHNVNVGPDFHLYRGKANRYKQDRDEMKTKTWLGIGTFFPAHDALATEGPGAIQDRTQEHTSSTDKAIVMQRLLLLKAVNDVQNGREAPHVVRTSAQNDLGHLGAADMIIPSGENWREAWQRAFRSIGKTLTRA